MMRRKGNFRPLRTSEVRMFFSWTQAELLAMLTSPAGCVFSGSGDLIPVSRVAFAINWHEPGIKFKGRVASIGYTTLEE